MDLIATIHNPIRAELEQFTALYGASLTSDSTLLKDVLEHIKSRAGKRMRPILTLLVAKTFGEVSMVTQNAAIGLELLHTASLVHDDVVDEANMRRGQASVNAMFDNRASVLVGDFILATALLKIAQTRDHRMVECLAELGRTLASGELMQLATLSSEEMSEETYMSVIEKKTAAMFEMCAGLGALSVKESDEMVEKCKRFGRNLGMAFQIRDDIFDYYDNQAIGKPTGNDMAEGKLTLPVIYAVKKADNAEFLSLAMAVRRRSASADDIARLIAFTKDNGGIDYAERRAMEYRGAAKEFIDSHIADPTMRAALTAYLDYVVGRQM